MTKKTNPGYLLKLPDEMMAAAKALAEIRGQTLVDYIRRAIRFQMQWDAMGQEHNALRQAVEQGTQKTTVAANFAAVQSQAIMILLREWRKEDIQKAEGLPEDLARQKVQGDMDEALALAAAVFEDPQVQQRYAWVERPESTDDLPDWLTDDENPGD